ncbi:unknown [Prevotella sp. CAG:924]|nr:unknown [Prevotella sp. CAG:924]
MFLTLAMSHPKSYGIKKWLYRYRCSSVKNKVCLIVEPFGIYNKGLGYFQDLLVLMVMLNLLSRRFCSL